MDDYSMCDENWEGFLRKGCESYDLAESEHVDSAGVHDSDVHAYRIATVQSDRSIRLFGYRVGRDY